jgi:hypothetical protein
MKFLRVMSAIAGVFIISSAVEYLVTKPPDESGGIFVLLWLFGMVCVVGAVVADREGE